ncbi:hypothetical protein Tco_0015711 [Tanacetum coccineum]
MVEKSFLEIQGTFSVKIRDNTFNEIIGENAFKHIDNFLEVVGPLKIKGLSQDRFRLSVFPISLAGVASEWFKKDCISSVTTWENLVEKFIKKFYQLSDNHEEIETDDDDEPYDIAKIFKIEDNLFDYETPLCKAFNEFNYLLKINTGLFTFEIQEIKTYEEYELNNNMTGELEEPWSKNGDHKWYDDMTDGKLKEEALMHKARIEESWGGCNSQKPGAFTRRYTGRYYPKRYWELLAKEILGAITQRDTRSYYPKRHWELLPKERLACLIGKWRCMRVFDYKEVTRRCLEALELKGGDGGACKVLGWLLGDVMVVQGRVHLVHKGRFPWYLLFSVYIFVLSWGGSISSNSFLASILLVVVIIVMVVIVVVILIVVVVVIVGVVIVVAIIEVVVVVGGVSSILKLSFVIIEFEALKRQVVKFVFHFLDFNSRAIRIGQEPFQFGPSDPVGLFYPNRLGVCIPPGSTQITYFIFSARCSVWLVSVSRSRLRRMHCPPDMASSRLASVP